MIMPENIRPVAVTTAACVQCGKTSTVMVSPEEYLRLQDDENIQKIFPDMPPEKRELFITGTHPECWDKMFSDFNELYEQDF